MLSIVQCAPYIMIQCLVLFHYLAMWCVVQCNAVLIKCSVQFSVQCSVVYSLVCSAARELCQPQGLLAEFREEVINACGS